MFLCILCICFSLCVFVCKITSLIKNCVYILIATAEEKQKLETLGDVLLNCTLGNYRVQVLSSIDPASDLHSIWMYVTTMNYLIFN